MDCYYFSLNRGNFFSFLKGYIVNILGCADHNVSIKTTELCHCGMKAVIDNTNKLSWLCSSIVYFQKEAGTHIYGMGHCLLTPALNN